VEQSKVVLGLEEPALAEEVLHFLDRRPGIRVLEVVREPEALGEAMRACEADVAVVSPQVLPSGPVAEAMPVLVVAHRETTGVLRSALRARARGFYLWPEEREALARDAERAPTPSVQEVARPGRVVAVYGARGGAGATFLATNLAAALASAGTDTVLVDFDLFYGEVATALGLPLNGHGRTLADLGPVAEELSSDHLERVLHEHPRGFRVLAAPSDPALPEEVEQGLLASAVRVLRRSYGTVVLHLPRAVDRVTVAGLQAADAIVVVVTLDVLAFRDAHRFFGFLEGRGLRERCRLVVNRATRAEVVPRDAEQVFGLPPAAVIGMDRAVLRSQNRGELLAARPGRTARRIAELARQLVGEEGG
jgi:pilus assembly protein CpaE